MRCGQPLSASMVEIVCHLRKKGKNIREIAKTLEISPNTVLKILKNPEQYLIQGKRGRPPTVDEETRRKIKNLATNKSLSSGEIKSKLSLKVTKRRIQQILNTNDSDEFEKVIVPMEHYNDKLVMQVQKEDNDLLDSFEELLDNETEISLPHSTVRERNHVDLFFESVCSSVKAFAPKLIAETKMRVSQLICELEIRALKESDSIRNETKSATPLVVTPRERNHVDLFFESVSSSVQTFTPKLIAETKMRVSQLICEQEICALTESDDDRKEAYVATPLVVTPEASSTSGVNSKSHEAQEGNGSSRFEELF